MNKTFLLPVPFGPRPVRHLVLTSVLCVQGWSEHPYGHWQGDSEKSFLIPGLETNQNRRSLNG